MRFRIFLLLMTLGSWTPSVLAQDPADFATDAGDDYWIKPDVGVKSNRDSIGAQVRVTTYAGEQFSTVTTAGSYQSSSDKGPHFGMGAADSVREIEIRWPSSIHQVLTNQKVDTALPITEPTANSSKEGR